MDTYRGYDQVGWPVIIGSTCNFTETLDHGTALAEKNDYDYFCVECKVRVEDIDLPDQRICNREALRSQRRGVDVPPPDARHSEKYDHRTQLGGFKARADQLTIPSSWIRLAVHKSA